MGDDEVLGTGGNYVPRALGLVKKLGLGVGVHHVNVLHDDECGIFDGKPCNCDPDVELRVEA